MLPLQSGLHHGSEPCVQGLVLLRVSWEVRYERTQMELQKTDLSRGKLQMNLCLPLWCMSRRSIVILLPATAAINIELLSTTRSSMADSDTVYWPTKRKISFTRSQLQCHMQNIQLTLWWDLSHSWIVPSAPPEMIHCESESRLLQNQRKTETGPCLGLIFCNRLALFNDQTKIRPSSADAARSNLWTLKGFEKWVYYLHLPPISHLLIAVDSWLLGNDLGKSSVKLDRRLALPVVNWNSITALFVNIEKTEQKQFLFGLIASMIIGTWLWEIPVFRSQPPAVWQTLWSRTSVKNSIPISFQQLL